MDSPYVYAVVEQPISRDQLYIADEVFVCGTAAECIGLSEIDFRTIGDGKTGPVTRQIQKVYHDAIAARSRSTRVRLRGLKVENWKVEQARPCDSQRKPFAKICQVLLPIGLAG